MANRNFSNGGKIYSMHVSVVMANVAITIGSTGAVSSISSNLVSTVTRTSQGLYKLNMADPYSSVIAILGSATSPGSGESGILAIETATAPNTNINSIATPNVSIKTLDAAGAVADPASGSIINVVLLLSNSQTKSGSAQ